MAQKAKSKSESSLVELLRKVIGLLNKQTDIVHGVLFHTLRGSMQERLTGFGISNIAHFLLLMQEIGLLRRWGGGATSTWQVVEEKFFDEMVVLEWLERAQVCLEKHFETTDQLRTLKSRVSELEEAQTDSTAEVASGSPPVGEQTLAEIAAMTVELQEVRAALAAGQERIRFLETELAKKPVFDADAALAAAIRRARGG